MQRNKVLPIVDAVGTTIEEEVAAQEAARPTQPPRVLPLGLGLTWAHVCAHLMTAHEPGHMTQLRFCMQTAARGTDAH